MVRYPGAVTAVRDVGTKSPNILREILVVLDNTRYCRPDHGHQDKFPQSEYFITPHRLATLHEIK